jgi:hypothetical protein
MHIPKHDLRVGYFNSGYCLSSVAPGPDLTLGQPGRIFSFGLVCMLAGTKAVYSSGVYPANHNYLSRRQKSGTEAAAARNSRVT